MRRGLVRVSAAAISAVIAVVLTTAALVPAEEESPSKDTAKAEAVSDKTDAEPGTTSLEAGKDTKPPGKDSKWKVTKPDLSEPVMEADNSYCIVCHADF